MLCRFLKPGGAMYPSHARLYMGAMRSNHTHQRVHEFQVCANQNVLTVACKRAGDLRCKNIAGSHVKFSRQSITHFESLIRRVALLGAAQQACPAEVWQRLAFAPPIPLPVDSGLDPKLMMPCELCSKQWRGGQNSHERCSNTMASTWPAWAISFDASRKVNKAPLLAGLQ